MANLISLSVLPYFLDPARYLRHSDVEEGGYYTPFQPFPAIIRVHIP